MTDYTRIMEALAGDVALVAGGDRSSDVLGTLRVNRDVAQKNWPDDFLMGALIQQATELLEKSR
jgi:hypothetical protein